jgi:hypothetical protein
MSRTMTQSNNPVRSSDAPRASAFAEEHLTLSILHPLQFQDIWRGASSTPERELAVAVLENATTELRNNRYARGRRCQRYYMQAYQWIASDDREWPFSFVNLCEFLALSPQALRQELLGEPAGHRVAEAA